jgi:hypothetical protein
MRQIIVVHPEFDGTWPFVANHLHKLWPNSELIRLSPNETRSIEQLIPQPETMTQLIALMAPITASGLESFASLKEVVIYTNPYGGQADKECLEPVLKGSGPQVRAKRLSIMRSIAR